MQLPSTIIAPENADAVNGGSDEDEDEDDDEEEEEDEKEEEEDDEAEEVKLLMSIATFWSAAHDSSSHAPRAASVATRAGGGRTMMEVGKIVPTPKASICFLRVMVALASLGMRGINPQLCRAYWGRI